MSDNLQELVARERDTYNTGLQRRGYDSVFHHANWLMHLERIKLFRTIVAGARLDRALEIGSSTWADWLESNAIVPGELYCINISEREIEAGRERARHTRNQPNFILMDAHHLEFSDSSFDLVFGSAILHHLRLDRALAEIDRVLRPGGLFVFFEPLDNNPVARFVRRLTPFARTADETPFRRPELAMICDRFECRTHFEQLFVVPAGIVSRGLFRSEENALMRGALRLDRWMLATMPWLGPYSRKVMLVGRR